MMLTINVVTQYFDAELTSDPDVGEVNFDFKVPVHYQRQYAKSPHIFAGASSGRTFNPDAGKRQLKVTDRKQILIRIPETNREVVVGTYGIIFFEIDKATGTSEVVHHLLNSVTSHFWE